MKDMQGGTKTFRKNANLAVVLHTIRRYGRVSRIELARILGLNRSTITHIVSYLLETGIVCVDSEGEPSHQGGRKPVFLRINGEFGAVAGMEVHSTGCRAVLLALDGREIVRRTLFFDGGETPDEPVVRGTENETEKKDSKADEPGGRAKSGGSGNNRRGFLFAGQCRRALREMRTEAETRGYHLIGAGIGVPGVVDPFQGRILRSSSLLLEDFDFVQSIDAAFPFPVLVENDANCCALRELRNPLGSGGEHFIYLLPKFNTTPSAQRRERVIGIGMGIVIGGEIYHGNSFAAGEFRSVFWKRGNSEQVNLKNENLLTIEEDGHILRRFFREVALNLSPVISVLNPGRIYIGGDAGRYYDVLSDVIRSELNERYIGLKERDCELVPADYDNFDVARGGGTLVFEKLFGFPELRRAEEYYSLDWETVLHNAKAAAERDASMISAESSATTVRHNSVVL